MTGRRAAPRRVTAAVALALALVGAALVQPAGATLAWPHFLFIHVASRDANTRIVIDAAYAGIRWVSQPGVAADDYLVRIDQSGLVRSLDAKLTFWRQGVARANVVRVTIGGGTWTSPATATELSFSGPGGPNSVRDGQPDRVVTRPPMDFEVFLGKQCFGNQFIQVTPGWTGTVWASAPGPNAPPYGNSPLPGSTPPGLYRLRWDGQRVVELRGRLTFTPLRAKPWDVQPHLGVLIVHSCDRDGAAPRDGADVVGYDYENGPLYHQTTWAQGDPDNLGTVDAGYGWQVYNCGQDGVCNSEPRISLAGCNYIVQVTTGKDPNEIVPSNTSVCNPGGTTTTTRPPGQPGRTTTTLPFIPPPPPPPPPPGAPSLRVTPPLGPAGFVTEATGTGFPPGATVALVWRTGLGSVLVTADGAGAFRTMVPVVIGDRTGPRQLVAVMALSEAASTDFLVVPSPFQPASAFPIQLFRR